MDYVKGCDITVLTKYNLKKVEDGRIRIADSLSTVLSYEKLSSMLTEAKKNFVDCNGKTIKDMPTSEIFIMIKKINKQKYIIGLSVMKRIAGAPSEKKGIERWFEESRDRVVEDLRFFADGFEKEKAYFDESMISHFKSSVGSGQIGTAEYQDRIISRIKSKNILGITVTATSLFILNIIIWGVLFKNIAIGICFALCFSGSYTMITYRAKTEEKELSKTEIES